MTAGDASAPSIAALPRPRGGAAGAWARRAGRGWRRCSTGSAISSPRWPPVGLGLGTAAWFVPPDARARPPSLLLAVAGLLSPLVLAPGARWARAAAIFCLAAILGCANLWWKAERVAARRLDRAQMAAFAGSVESLQKLAAKETVRLVVAPQGAPVLPPRLRINVDQVKLPAGVEAGATVRVRAWLMPPAPPAAPGAPNFARFVWF